MEVKSILAIICAAIAVNLEGEKNVNITLKEDLEQLDEVVVVGYVPLRYGYGRSLS